MMTEVIENLTANMTISLNNMLTTLLWIIPFINSPDGGAGFNITPDTRDSLFDFSSSRGFKVNYRQQRKH